MEKKVCAKRFIRMRTEGEYFSPGQAAIASPVNSKLSPVENTVAPGNRKRTLHISDSETRHFRTRFQNKTPK